MTKGGVYLFLLVCILLIGVASADLNVSFNSPTPDDGDSIYTSNITVNATITGNQTNVVIYSWNFSNSSLFDESTVIYMNFDNLSVFGENDSNVVDVSGNGNNGTVTGAVWNASGRYGGAYAFDGTSGKYITLPYQNVGENLTYSFWYNSDADSIRPLEYMKTSVKIYASGGVRWYADLDQGYIYLPWTKPSGWVHFVLTQNGTNASVYINGDLKSSLDTSYTVNTANGRNSIGIYAGSTDYFNGSIDDLSIWSRPLSAEEVNTLYHSSLSKYDLDKWNLIVNQENNQFGNFTFYVWINESTDNSFLSDVRTVNFRGTYVPKHLHLTWRNSTQTNTTMVVNWREEANDTTSMVLYNISQGQCQDYPNNKTAETVDMFNTSEYMKHAELTGLEPDTLYHFCILNEEGISSQYSFRTAPSNGTNFTFIAGSDTQGGISYLENLLNQSMGYEPLFILYVGDSVEEGTDEVWSEFFNATQYHLKTDSNRLIPIIPALGNHESVSDMDFIYWHENYELPEEERYFYHDIGSLRVITLNLISASSTAQFEFLEESLKEARYNDKWVITQGHYPFYPSRYAIDSGTISLRENYGTLFDKYHVQANFEGHDHKYKRTYPMFNNQTTSPGNGTVYLTGILGYPKGTVNESNVWAFEEYSNNSQAVIIGSFLNDSWLNFSGVNDTGGVIDSFTIPFSCNITGDCGCIDEDGDGYGIQNKYGCSNYGLDCNDTNSTINPGAGEICGNGIDDDCNAQVDEGCGSAVCGDGDLWITEEECDDNNTDAGDGCAANCSVELGYNCTGSPSVCSGDLCSCLDLRIGCGNYTICGNVTDCGECVERKDNSWDPIIGIPEPPFGINETNWLYENLTFDYGSGPENYHVSDDGPYTHYIDMSHPNSSDADNPLGTPSKPRKTFPSRGLVPGSIVELHGGTYTGTFTFEDNGTFSNPIFIRGVNGSEPIVSGFFRILGSYYIIENIDFDRQGGIRKAIMVGEANNSYVAIRYNEVHNFARVSPEGSQMIYLTHSNTNETLKNIVVYNNHVHHNGEGQSSYDVMSIVVGNNMENVWVVYNNIHHSGGDSVPIMSSSYDPTPLQPNHIYIGGNVMHDDYENAIDIKTGSHIVISQNKMYNFGPEYGYKDYGSPIVLHAADFADHPHQNTHIWTIFNEAFNLSSDYAGFSSFYTLGNNLSFPDEIYFLGNILHDCHTTNGSYAGKSAAFTSLQQNKVYWLNNLMYNCDRGGSFLGDRGMENARGKNDNETIIVRNNIFGNIHSGSLFNLSMDVGGTNESVNRAEITNNLFYREDGPVLIKHLEYVNGSVVNGQPIYNYTYFSTLFPNHTVASIEGNPNHTSPDNNNFTPQSRSPLINSGYNVSEYYGLFEELYNMSIEVDFYNNPIRGEWDIGPIEYQGIPLIELSYPPNDYVNDTTQSVSLVFNATVTDNLNLGNCSLWHNATGVWHLNQTQNLTGTSNLTSFNLVLRNLIFVWNIECYDNESHSNWGSNRTVTLNYSSSINPPSENPSGGGGGGWSGTYGKTYLVDYDQLFKGYNNELGVGDSLKMNFTEWHYLRFNEISENYIKINVTSELQQAIISIGEVEKFELNGDGYYDLSVKLLGISGGKANLTVMGINDLISEKPLSEVSVPEDKLNEDYGGDVFSGEELTGSDELVKTWVLTIIIILIIIVGVLLIFYRKKRRRKLLFGF